MIYRDFQDLHLSLLGFGTMRLPTTVDGAIDEDTTQAMVDYALAHGVNYFDTAWPYMQNLSETVVGRCLKKYPRDSFYLATKYPGHMLTCDPDPAGTFAQQLEKCQVDYFDFYLLHNVYENDVDIYTDPRWGIIDYFVEQKRLGRIKHLGFSTHADLPCLTAFLERYGKEMEFCQIQLNYLDWTIQRAREKYELLEKHHIPVWVMEPVRGGKLAALDADSEQQLHALRPNASIASFGFRWLQGLDNVHMVLSGMSDMAQMADNVATFENLDPLSPAEEAILFAAADKMKNSIPCTACRYCCDGCPQQLDIPDLLHKYNQLRTGSGSTKGVDADAVDAVTEANLDDGVQLVKTFAQRAGCIVAVTGAIDLVSDGERCWCIRNGRAEMSRITGTGCQLSALMTAFLVANPDHKLAAAAAAVCMMGLAGEIGWANMQPGDGNSTYRNRIIGAIFNMTGDALEKGAKYELR